MINELYDTKEAAFEAGKSVGRLDLDGHAKRRMAELEAALRKFMDGCSNDECECCEFARAALSTKDEVS